MGKILDTLYEKNICWLLKYIFMFQTELAFRLMLTGRPELIQQSLALLPTSTRLDMLNQQGHTALMLSALYNDDLTLMVIVNFTRVIQ